MISGAELSQETFLRVHRAARRYDPDNPFQAWLFTIAHNLAQGHGATFDGLYVTNGFHPLWQLLLVPLFAFFRDDPFTPIRAALSLSLLLDLASATLLARIWSSKEVLP